MGGSKYDPLRDYLRQRGEPEIVLSLEEIEDILGFELQSSAATPNWWANTRSPAGRAQRQAWAAAGYDAFFLKKELAVRFLSRSGRPNPGCV